MKKTIWQPLVLGVVFGLLAGISTITGLSFLGSGITDNAIGFYMTLFLLAAALGGPLAGAIAPAFWVTISAWFGSSDIQTVLSDQVTFWSNIVALGATLSLVGYIYRLIFVHVKMPVRLLYWAGIVIATYIIALPASLIPQYFWSAESKYELLPALLSGYTDYAPQAIFDILFTFLIFVALPLRYRRPLWYKPNKTQDRSGES